MSEILDDIAEARSDAEALMIDTCTVEVLGDPAVDRATGKSTVPRTVVYPDPAWPETHRWARGPCKVQAAQSQESNPEAGGHSSTEQRYRVDFPVGSFKAKPGMVVTILTAPADPLQEGTTYKLVAPFGKTLATAQRCFAVEEV
jgi:hypothetical protein